MFEFIAFGFKLLFAAIAGGALSYIPGEETQNPSKTKRRNNSNLRDWNEQHCKKC